MDRKEINNLLNYVENNRVHLNSLQNEFITSLQENYNKTGVLTKRQVEFLQDVKEYITSIYIGNPVYESDSDKNAAQYSSFDHLSVFRI
jgi:hypothetical protein